MLIPYQLQIKKKYRYKSYCPVINFLAYDYFKSIGRHFLTAELIAVKEQISRGEQPDISNYKYLVDDTKRKKKTN